MVGDDILSFLRALTPNEPQTASSKIRTQLVKSISYKDNIAFHVKP